MDQISADFMKAFGCSRSGGNKGRTNQLHLAATVGSLQGVREALSRGSIDIDEGNPDGASPLILAAEMGHTDVIDYLLNVGRAYPFGVTHQGCNALHLASVNGHLAACKLLIQVQEARSDLDETTDDGYTCLHMSAMNGHTDVMEALIAAGENTDGRLPDGRTPLHMCAMEGHLGAVKVLLRAKANALLTSRTTPVNTYTPLDTAVRHGRLEVVRELIQQLGIQGCAGASGGTEALRLAAQNDHVDILAMLAETGVEDKGTALVGAIAYGREAPVKALLQLKERATGNTRAYVNMFAEIGEQLMGTPLLMAIGLARHRPHPRIVRMLVDAGADTASALPTRVNVADATALEFATRFIREKKVDGEEATEEQLHKLEAIRRLLLRVESVRAVSWLWPKYVISLRYAAEGARKAKAISTPMRRMLPVLRRRALKRGLSPETLFRFSRKLS